jgi:hypothetical protein
MTANDTAEAIHTVSSAWIPFILAVVAMGALMWLPVRWAYLTQLHKAKKYKQRVDKFIARLRSEQNELKEENKKKGFKIAELEREKELLSPDGQKALEELAHSKKITEQTLEELDDDRLETNLDAGSASSVKPK